jgi:hypothetical protein
VLCQSFNHRQCVKHPQAFSANTQHAGQNSLSLTVWTSMVNMVKLSQTSSNLPHLLSSLHMPGRAQHRAVGLQLLLLSTAHIANPAGAA